MEEKHAVAVADEVLRDAVAAELGRGVGVPGDVVGQVQVAGHGVLGHLNGGFRGREVLVRQAVPVVAAQHDGELGALDGVGAEVSGGRVRGGREREFAVRVEDDAQDKLWVLGVVEGLWEEVAEAVVGEVGLRGGVPDVDEHDGYRGGGGQRGETIAGYLGEDFGGNG